RRPHGGDVRRDAEEVAVVPERPVVDDLVVDDLPEAVGDDDPERHQEEGPEEDDRRQEAGVGGGGLGEPPASRGGCRDLGGRGHSSPFPAAGSSSNPSAASQTIATSVPGAGIVVTSCPWSAMSSNARAESHATFTRTWAPRKADCTVRPTSAPGGADAASDR